MHERDFGSERGSKFNAQLGRMDCERRGIGGNQDSSEAHKDLLIGKFIRSGWIVFQLMRGDGAACATRLGAYLGAGPN